MRRTYGCLFELQRTGETIYPGLCWTHEAQEGDMWSSWWPFLAISKSCDSGSTPLLGVVSGGRDTASDSRRSP